MREKILETVRDVASNFVNYDLEPRNKESAERWELTKESLREALKSGDVTIGDIGAEFMKSVAKELELASPAKAQMGRIRLKIGYVYYDASPLVNFYDPKKRGVALWPAYESSVDGGKTWTTTTLLDAAATGSVLMTLEEARARLHKEGRDESVIDRIHHEQQKEQELNAHYYKEST